MAKWIPPKTNWSVEDVPGLGDFKRIEGNTEYLKGQTDGLKNGSIKAGNAVKLGGQSPSYYAKQADIDGLKNGSIKAGNAVKLGGQSPSYYAKQADIDGLKNGSIAAGKATNATNANNADTVDGYHASEIWTRVTPGNTIILSSTSHSGAPSTGYTIAKQFQVRYPGRYRISFAVSGSARVKVTLDDQTQGIEMDPAPSNVTLDLPHVPWGGIITVYIARQQSSWSASVYNCYLKGSITTSRPANSVLVE